MTKRAGFRRRLVTLIAMLTASLIPPSLSAAGDLVLGPVTCQRGTGPPTVFEHAFPATEPSRGYVIKVSNGGLEDATYELVSSSTITLNGTEIFGPGSFNEKVAFLEAPVALQAQNSLNVEVRGKPGGAIVIRIYPLVVIDSPPEGRIFGANQVVVTGRLYLAATSVSVNGIPGTVVADTFTITGIPLAQGSNVLTAIATRESGLPGSDSVQVTSDAIAPTVTITHPPEGLVTNGDVALAYSVSDALDPLPAVTITPAPPYTSDGRYQLVVAAVDWAGNSTEATRRFIIDRAPPIISAAPLERQYAGMPAELSARIATPNICDVFAGRSQDYRMNLR